LDGRQLWDGKRLVAKISDPEHKKDRSGALYEGREVYVSNVDWSASEDEVRELFQKHGTVEKVRIPRNLAGKSKGIAFVVFSTKARTAQHSRWGRGANPSRQDEADQALELDQQRFKSRVLHVSISEEQPEKRQATTIITTRSTASLSPAPEPQNDDAPASPRPSHPSREEIAIRTIALMNLPDTVNDARVRTLAEPYGELVKIIMRHDHQGAIIEYRDPAAAGAAALGIDGHEIAPGRRLRVGTVEEMKQLKAEKRSDKLSAPKPAKKAAERQREADTLQPPSVIRRPAQSTGRGGRGKLGVRRGGIGLGGSRATAGGSTGDADEKMDVNGAEQARDGRGMKTNADFKAMFSKS
jgi:squamous cell carcinoma antigen recognized by T-cells 3